MPDVYRLVGSIILIALLIVMLRTLWLIVRDLPAFPFRDALKGRFGQIAVAFVHTVGVGVFFTGSAIAVSTF